MTAIITIDSSGRLVLPKAMRDALHLRPGSKLRAEIIGDKISLGSDVEEALIIRSPDGLPVVVGWEGFDAVKAIAESRKEHEDRILAYRNRRP
jgi:AbrB family looped-hinge helix DNA binding protein